MMIARTNAYTEGMKKKDNKKAVFCLSIQKRQFQFGKKQTEMNNVDLKSSDADDHQDLRCTAPHRINHQHLFVFMSISCVHF